jgi:hypothetical protein
MHRFFSLRRVAPALVAFGILGFALSAAADEDRPFRGRADVEVTDIAPVEEGLLLTATATGRATHLGRFTRHERVLLRADGTFQGRVVFTAANGDKLFVDAEGAFTSATTADGTYTFVGGTGRFRDASGEAAFQAVTSDGVHIAIRFKGSIDY